MNKTLKELVDSYLNEKFYIIEEIRKLNKIDWKNVANKIAEEKGIDVPNKEYVRSRFNHLRKQVASGMPYNPKLPVVENVFKGLSMKDLVERDIKLLTGELKPERPEYFTITNKQAFAYDYKENTEKRTAEVKTETEVEIKTAEELFEHLKLDANKWKITNWWCKRSATGRYAVSANLKNIEHSVEGIKLTGEFLAQLDKIKGIDYSKIVELSTNPNTPKASLLIPKQDSHWNKQDIDGKNSIEERFAKFTKILVGQLEKVRLTNQLEEINYIVGSDEFNSEWNSLTTKGTPQSNIMSHQEAFEKITNFNIETIKLLRYYAPKVNVILLNGNHDEYVGWHLAHVLKMVFSKIDSISVDITTENSKVVSYGDNLVLLNHQDVIKPVDLAAKFPIIAKDQWSKHSNYFVISGDKHHENSHDYNGTLFFQVPQLSTSKSKWDDKQGYITSKAEFVAFLFEEDGLSNILRKIIK